MYGIFVNERGCMRYASLLADGVKTIETRNKNMLSGLVGQRVAIVRTRKTHPATVPTVVGYVTISDSFWCDREHFQDYYDRHFVPSGSMYDADRRGKWMYVCTGAEKCEPFQLPKDAVRHGRSWCEF